MTEHNIHFLKFTIDRDLSELYISMVIRAVAFSMIGIFVPLYLFNELNYNLSEIAIYYIVLIFVFGAFTIPASKLISKIGIKKVILISSPIYVIYFILLHLLKTNPGIFLLVPAIAGLGDALFWLAFHEDFSNFSDKKKRGEEVGIFYSLSILSGMAGPLVGGIILTFFGFTVLFVVVSILTLLSSVPLFFSKDIKRKSHFDLNFLKHANIKETIALMGLGARGIIYTVFWPIFIFIILGAYLKVGSLATVIGLITAVSSFIVGRLSDTRVSKKKFIKFGSIFHSITWFVRIFVKTQFHLIGIALLDGISYIMMELPLNAIIYDRAGKKDGNYLIYRELSLCFGRIIVLILIWLTGSLIVSFGLAGLASLAYLFM